MLKLSFHQTQAEFFVRIASTVIFNELIKAGCTTVDLSQLTEEPQYGYTASAVYEEVGPKFVRITDLQDSQIDWDKVPYCECPNPESYLLQKNDILFARTGATTGKTYLVSTAPNAIFASYLIRVRPKNHVLPKYLYSFFQSNSYWSQIIDEKQGSAQPNVNGKKLMGIKLPLVDELESQAAIGIFLDVVRARQDGYVIDLPHLPYPLMNVPHIVAHIEALAARIAEARGLRQGAIEEVEGLFAKRLTTEFAPYMDRCFAIGDVFKVTNGSTPSRSNPTYWNGNIKWVSSGEVAFNRITDTAEMITEQGLANSSAKLYPPNTVLIAMIGQGKTRGQCAILDCYAATNQNVAGIHVYETNHLPEYVYWWLYARYAESRSKEIGTAYPALNGQRVKEMMIPLPDVDDQRRIVTHLTALKAQVDKLKLLQSETAAELDALLPSILDRAFRGEL